VSTILDLKEIPAANSGSGDQDEFELFARDFLEATGFTVVEGPGRGVDRGRDLIVEELVTGSIYSGARRWVVSAKHNAHSGRSVTDGDEPDPVGRVRKFGAHGFMGFYSTVVSSGLDDTLSRLRGQIDIHVFDRGRITTALIQRIELQHVFRTYLPGSYARWRAERQPTVLVGGQVLPLACCYCGKDILLSPSAIVVFVESYMPRSKRVVIEDVYWCCKGSCDRSIQHSYERPPLTGWEDLADLRIPHVFLRWICATLNNLQSGHYVFRDEAHRKHVEFLIILAQAALRDPTDPQRERLDSLVRMPAFLGGMANGSGDGDGEEDG
jgi:hypothetical protein